MKSVASRLLALPGFVEALLALAVLGCYHGLLVSQIAGWAEFLYPLGASWGYRDWRGLAAAFTPEYHTAFRYGKGDWVPATFAYFFFVRKHLGATPAAVNAGAVLLLVLGSWAAAAVGRSLTRSALGGLVAGLVFGLHPLLWDASMAMLTSHLLMSLFLMLAFRAHLRGGAAGRTLSSLCYLAAMFSKPPGVVFPALLLVHELSRPAGGLSWRERLGRSLLALSPFIIPAVVFLALFRWVNPGMAGVTSTGFSQGWTVLDPLQRIAAVGSGLLGLRHGPAAWAVCAGLLAAAALSGRLLFFLGWSLLSLSPYLNLIPLEGLSRAMSFKDFQPRYALLASAALGWAAAAGLLRGLERGGWPRRAAQGLLLLLAAGVLARICFPIKTKLSPMPLTRFMSLSFVRAADPGAYARLLEEESARYGPAAAGLFAEVSGSGLLFEDPDAASWVRHIVYDLEFRPIFEPALPADFIARLGEIPAMQRDWLAARRLLEDGRPDEALAPLTRALEAAPTHAQALLAASAVLAQGESRQTARLLYAAARTETGLGHEALLAVVCGRLGPACARLGLKEAAYEQAVRGAMDADPYRPRPPLVSLPAADRDLVWVYGRAMAANGRFTEADRACTAALKLLGSGAPRGLRADILLERAAARLHIGDSSGAARDLEDIRPLVGPSWAGQRRWQALKDKALP